MGKDILLAVFAVASLYLSGMIGAAIGFFVGRHTTLKPWEDL